MGAFTFLFGGSKGSSSDCEIPEIYPLSLKTESFIQSDILSTYLKILTDTIERVHGIPDALNPLLWDNCLQNEANEGLISLLALAMTNQKELFLVYSSSTKVLRRATREEEDQIRKDYKEKNESATGAFISFKGYRRTEMLRIYSSFEYCVLSSLNKSLNLAKAVQVKIKDLRTSVSLNDSEIAKAQGREIAVALGKGNDIMVDGGDTLETAKVDTEPSEKAIAFLDAKKAFILGLPLSYISGEQTSGIGSTGEADMRAVERGLKQYFVSILYPVLKTIFKKETEFKSQDFRQVTSALEALKTFELVSDENLSRESKQEILARMFELDPKKEQKALEKEAAEREEEGGEDDDTEETDPQVPQEGR